MTAVGLPSWAAEPLSWVGLRWPDGDPARLTIMSDDWLRYANEIGAELWNAERSAEDTWNQNAGQAVEVFEYWWNLPDGPAENLRRTVHSAENISTALRAMAAQVVAMQAVFLVELMALAALAALLAKALLAGSIVAGAAQTTKNIAVDRSRKTLSSFILKVAGLALAGAGVAWLLREAALRKAPPVPSPTPDPRQKPRPRPQPAWTPELRPKEPDQNPRCFLPPGSNVTAQYFGDLTILDQRVRGGGIHAITAQRFGKGENAYHVYTLDGVVQDTNVPNKFAGFIQGMRGPLGLTTYDASHTWGGIIGSEAAAGLLLAPEEMNRSYMKRAENYLQGRYDALRDEGGWLALRAHTTTHRLGAATYVNDQDIERLGGHYLMSNITYNVTECLPHSRGGGYSIRNYEFGISVDPPRPDGTAGKIWPSTSWP